MTLPPLATAFDARQTASLSDDRIAAKATRDEDCAAEGAGCAA